MSTLETEVYVDQVEDLIELFTKNPDYYFVCRDTVNGVTYRIKGSALTGGESVQANWIYDFDYNAGQVVQANGKWWQSLINDENLHNENNFPTEGAFWTEVSKSVGDGSIAYWAAGVYTANPSIVLEGTSLYLLKSSVTLPYNSTTAPSVTPTHWDMITGGGGSTETLTVVKVNSSTTTTHNAVKNTIVLYNTTTAPSTCVVPDPVIGNSDLFAFKNVGTTHKLTIQTESGTVIGVIPSIDTMVQIKCNGTGYDILNDTRALWLHEHVTTSRSFTSDGLEDNVMYIYELTSNEIMILKAPVNPLNNKAYQSHHELKGTGTVTFVREDGGLIGGKTSQVIAIDGTGFDIIEADGEYHLMYDSRTKAPNTSFVSYPLTESTAIVDSVTGLNFLDRALSIDDSDFNKTTQTFTSTTITANPSDPYQQLQPSICPQGAIQGLIPEGNIDIFWNIYKTGAIDIDVYVGYYKRSALGVETLICNSQVTRISNITEQQINIKAVHSQFNIDPADYIVIRRFAKKVSTGVNPTLNTGSEGANPTRSIIEVSAANISHESISGRSALNQHPAGSISDTAPIGFTGTNQHDINTQFATEIKKDSIAFHLSDVASSVTGSTTVSKNSFRCTFPFTLLTTPATVYPAPTGASAIIDIHKNGTSIYSTRPTIDAGEFSTDTAATPAVLSTTSFAVGDLVEGFIDQCGSVITGSNYVIYLNISRT